MIIGATDEGGYPGLVPPLTVPYHRVVTYRDLALHPQEQLGDLMSWLEMEFSPAQLEYWKIDHHGTQKPDYVQSIGGGYFDLRWQSDLDAQVQTGIMQIPEIERYLTELELGVEADGLCATGPGPLPVPY